MKKCVNGIYIEMTPEEIAAMQTGQMEQMPTELTIEERIAAIEEELVMSKILLGVET